LRRGCPRVRPLELAGVHRWRPGSLSLRAPSRRRRGTRQPAPRVPFRFRNLRPPHASPSTSDTRHPCTNRSASAAPRRWLIAASSNARTWSGEMARPVGLVTRGGLTRWATLTAPSPRSWAAPRTPTSVERVSATSSEPSTSANRSTRSMYLVSDDGRTRCRCWSSHHDATSLTVVARAENRLGARRANSAFASSAA
jgi:hypothetical protein